MTSARTRIIVALVTAGIAASGPVTAGAAASRPATAVAATVARPASRDQAIAMLYHASGRDYDHVTVAEPRSVPLACFVADVVGSTWGAWSFSPYAERHGRRCRTGNGIAIEQRIGGRWYVLWEGSGGYPPRHDQREGRLTLHGVPRAVARALIGGLASG